MKIMVGNDTRLLRSHTFFNQVSKFGGCHGMNPAAEHVESADRFVDGR
jgi:hypothetical protein